MTRDPRQGGPPADATDAVAGTATAPPPGACVAKPASLPSPAGRGDEPGLPPGPVILGLVGVLAVPLLIALVAVRSPTWYPLVDMAQIEMRVRDVGPTHPPLVGLGGRIVADGARGSHPGPLSFYAMAPVYRVLGSSAWAMQASAVVLEILALGGTMWMAHRRWRLWGALLVAGALAPLMHLYGTEILVYPWNPYLPVLFWVSFLVAVWGVACDDLALLPVATVAGSLCAQTHLPYLGLVGGFGLAVVALLAARYRRLRRDPPARRRLVGWTGASAALAVLIWSPALFEQLSSDGTGNLRIILDSVRHPVQPAVGFGEGLRLWLERLDPAALARTGGWWSGSRSWGLVTLALWAVAATGALRLGDRTLVRLHAVLGLALGLGLVAMARILGPAWPYLMLWAWGTAALAWVAIVATAAATVAAAWAHRGAAGGPNRRWHRSLPAAALAVVIVVPTVGLARQAGDPQPDAQLSGQLGVLVPQVVDAIDGASASVGPSASYLVTWSDPVNLGALGYGLLLELERRGYDVGAPPDEARAVRQHRVVDASGADAEIHLSVGEDDIRRWGDRDDAVRIAHADVRTPEERARWQRQRDEIVDRLEVAGRADLVAQLDRDAFGLAAAPDLPEEVGQLLFALNQLPPPAAVFVRQLTAVGADPP